MRNADRWRPTRFVPTKRGWRASRDPKQVGVGSRFIANLVIPHYEALLRQHARGHLLDLGCGAVPYFAIYRNSIDECRCVDWPQSGYEIPHVDAYADLNEELPLADDAFDTVLLTDVLEHIARPAALVGEIARVLRPGGTLILTTPFLYWLHEQPHDYFRCTEFALRRFCEEASLEIVSLEPYGGAPDVILDIVAKHLAFSALLAATATAVGRAVAWPFRCLTQRTARKFPLGYCLVARAVKTRAPPGR